MNLVHFFISVLCLLYSSREVENLPCAVSPEGMKLVRRKWKEVYHCDFFFKLSIFAINHLKNISVSLSTTAAWFTGFMRRWERHGWISCWIAHSGAAPHALRSSLTDGERGSATVLDNYNKLIVTHPMQGAPCKILPLRRAASGRAPSSKASD